ncbi:endoglucanase [Dethiosulfatibacter aminovorans DSM 17477]|uniref:Endoglucanase n=1 Tax=Dethiosulfatibacter aminovorans DSM 17477 TaxID=1121476 RepID=A0A1M6C1Z3_9FIRM|nr:M20/M25/M40 family metallo-hydrolase [Dethiosulfatibacter aminovorans]SHI54963.1 endoglucanase [Dethiosulfatibacter aminovorans DSM 17477]
MDTAILKKLCSINAVPTQEDKVNTIIRDMIKDYVDEISEDRFGNMIAHRKGSGPRFMLTAHTDQIGLMIHGIEENGCLRFTAVGGLIPFTLIGQRVVINDTVMGTIGVDIDLEAGGDLGKAGVNNMYVDIGVNSKEAAEKKVSIGDFGNFCSEFYENDEIVMSRALDDRAGCFVLIEVIKALKESKYDLYFVFTSQEESGTRGAYTASYSIEPEYGIAVDITPSGDLPGTKNSTASLGNGAGIKLMDPSLIINPEMKSMLVKGAEDNNIPYQFEVMKRGGTDAGAFQSVQTGVKSAAVSIVTRNAHTANEIVSKNDIQAVIDMLISIL